MAKLRSLVARVKKLLPNEERAPSPRRQPAREPFVRGIDKCYQCDTLLARYAEAKAAHLAAIAQGTHEEKVAAEKARLRIRQQLFDHRLKACLRDTFHEQ